MASTINAITFDCAKPLQLVEFWTAALGYVVGATFNGDAAIVVDPDGRGTRLAFMKVPEGKTVKNRVHLELTPDGSMAAEVGRLVALGARTVEVAHEAGRTWTVMQDPEANEFCVCEPKE